MEGGDYEGCGLIVEIGLLCIFHSVDYNNELYIYLVILHGELYDKAFLVNDPVDRKAQSGLAYFR